MEMLNDLLRQSLLALLWIGSFAGILLGAGIWLKPQQVIRMNRAFSRWVSTERAEVALDRPRVTERFFYRHHRIVGAAILIGAALTLYTFLFSYNLRRISGVVPHSYWWLADALIAVVLVASGLAALVGVLVLTKPSVLRALEDVSNHWVSTERFQTMVSKPHFSAEQSITRHHRIAGPFIMLGSLYVLAVLGYFLFFGEGKWW